MKKLSLFICICLLFSLSACSAHDSDAEIVATTLPVYEFTYKLCSGTGLNVTRLITENVSCLHDYTLNVDQMRAIENAQLIVISGAGLESFFDDAFASAQKIVDASVGLSFEEDHHHTHHEGHEVDPHIWLSPEKAMHMVQNICLELVALYPEKEDQFLSNRDTLLKELEDLQAYGEAQLSQLSCRKLITFHDGFHYFAESFDLEILRALEEESGSEASAQELISIIEDVNTHQLPAIFIETNGSDSAARIIAAETGVKLFTLDMVMSGESYFDSMYRNIHAIQEAFS